MPTVYSYLRFSRPEQLKGDSLRRQLQQTKDWAEQHKYHLDESLDLQDKGVSAFRGKNARQGALAMFLECVETGRVKRGDILAVESLDRLSRQEIDEAYELWRGILKAGVEIHTFVPIDHFTREDLNNPIKLIITITIMARANEESKTKSTRLREAWGQKRTRATEQKVTSIAPKWLKLGEDRKQFEPVPPRTDIVRQVFRMAADGMGANSIAKRLNQDCVPTFGKSKFWHVSYVKKILANRAVLGEYQPHRMVDGKREPSGEPIASYFPAIVSEREFYAVRRSTEDRKTQAGQHGKRLANLFTGLVKDARDGSNLTLVDKGNGPSLVSSEARQGVPGSVYVSFPYDVFERSLLIWGYDLKLGDVLLRKATNLEDEIRKSEGRLADVEHRIRTLKAKMKTAGNFDALVDLMVELEQERTESKEKIERLKRENATNEGESLDRTRELIERLGHTTEEEAYLLRLKLRATLRRFIRDIVVLVIHAGGERVAMVDVELVSGQRRRVTCFAGKRVTLPTELESLDIRDWQQWPRALRKARLEALTEDEQAMLELEAAGLSRTEIAERLQIAKSVVSRTLIKNGRRKGKRKPADSERLMTWHPQGRGWTKCYRGERHFIGLGKLATAFPRLMATKDADGSWKAANAWWKSKVRELDGNPAARKRQPA